MLSTSDINLFHAQGFLKLENFCPDNVWQTLKTTTLNHLEQRIEPLELEAELEYPGAPEKNTEGEETIRRIKQAYDRDECFKAWATNASLVRVLSQLMPSPLYLVKAHHNCVMTKHPKFSSDSWWHQDLRYWRYTQGQLISAWLSLGNENQENGSLQVIPGSHKMSFHVHQFDEAQFFRRDLEENQPTLALKINLEMKPGDLLLFHCRLLHAATRNYSSPSKLAAVFTYRTETDLPLEGSRSAASADVLLSAKALDSD